MEFFIVFLCILINGVLSASEMAFVTVRKSQWREAVKNGSRRADYLLKMRDRPERTLSIIQIGITLVGAIAAAVGGAGAEELLSPLLENRYGISEGAAEAISIIAIVIPITYFSVVFGELIPKSLALRHGLFISLWSSYPLTFLDKVLSPIVSLLEWSTRKFLGVFMPSPEPGDKAQEADQSIELDSLPSTQRQFVLNLVALGKRNLLSILTPWSDVVSAHTEMTSGEVKDILLRSRHTRLPVFENKEVVGILNSREFMIYRETGRMDWQTLIRKPVRIQHKTPLLHSLRMLQESKSHMAIVLSEDHDVGMVTMEDIFEEVVGEIYDEDDDGALKKILAMTPKGKV